MLAISPQSVLGKILRIPLRFIPSRSLLRVRSGINKDRKWIAGSSTHGCWLGWYESQLQTQIMAKTRMGMVAYDVGANAGFFALAFSALVGKEGQVIGFEPFAENSVNFLRHLKENNIQNTILIQAAVSKCDDIVSFEIAKNNSMGCLGTGYGAYMVPTVSLDTLVSNGHIPPPDLMKIDVEGAESLVLEGANNTILSYRPIIFLSLHSPEQKVRCAEILHVHGYSMSRLSGEIIEYGDQLPDEICATP